MKKVNNLLILFLISSSYFLLTGCNPHTSIVLSNDASLKKLNDIVKERSVRVTTTDSIYTGNNIIISRDSTTVEKYSTRPRVIPYSSMKNISYIYGSDFLEGYIKLNNELIKAQNIYIANNDTVIRFDEILTTSVIFPTKYLTKIQIRNHIASTLSGMGKGLWMGALTGALLGTFIGHVDDVPDNSGRPDGSGQGPSRLDNIVAGTIFGAIIGTIGGTFTGAILGQWEDIDITYRYEENSP